MSSPIEQLKTQPENPHLWLKRNLQKQLGIPTIRPLRPHEQVVGGILASACNMINRKQSPAEVTKYIQHVIDTKSESDAKQEIKSFSAIGRSIYKAPSTQNFIDAVVKKGGPSMLKIVYSALEQSHSSSAQTKALAKQIYDAASEHINEDLSTWGIYTLLNLAGSSLLKAGMPKQAVRFSHLLLGENNINLSLKNTKNAFEETFKKENRFRWINKLGRPTTEDPRLDAISFDQAQLYSLNSNGLQTLNNQNIETEANIDEAGIKNTKAPIVCVIDYDAKEEDVRHIHNQISNMLDKNPFVILLNKQEDNKYVGQIFTNHEYMDGIPASYYLRNFLSNAHIKVSDITDRKLIPDDQLKTTFKTADDIENSFAGEKDKRYRIHTELLNKNTLNTLNQSYTQILKNLKKHNLSIDPNTYMQYVLLDHAGVNGSSVLGGALRFKFENDTQLEHYSVGPVHDIMQILNNDHISEKDIIQLKEMGCIAPRKEGSMISLYNPSRDNAENENFSRENIGNIIGAVRKATPSHKWHLLNTLTKLSGAARALSGQAMASLIPAKMYFKYYDNKGNEVTDPNPIMLGGVGGPAVTEFQDVGYTIFVDYDKSEGFKRVIVRQKAFHNSLDDNI